MKEICVKCQPFCLTLSIVVVCALAVPASADYVVSPRSSDGLSSKTVIAGESFDLDIVLESDASDVHDVPLFQVVFSKPGLTYLSYTWMSPFANDGDGSVSFPDDDSRPLLKDLSVTLDADTLSRTQDPAGVVDVELSNSADSDFGVGVLVTMTLEVPSDWSPIPDSVLINVVPDTFTSGFATIPTTAGQEFTLNIIPEPASLGLLALGSLASIGRKVLSGGA